jgi:uncharacterized protein (DUF2062 family)
VVKSKDEILSYRWIKPFAHRLTHPSLWHINRRSLSKAIGLGLFAGFLVPIGQIVLAALLAIPARANVPVAVGATFVTNPFTFGPIWYGAWWTGDHLLRPFGFESHPFDLSAGYAWSAITTMIPITFGLVLFAFGSGVLGYLLGKAWYSAKLAWRWKARRAG